MRLKMPITRRRIHNHFHYGLWKYLLLIAIALFGWNLIYTTTRYRPPESAKLEFFAESSSLSNDALQALADQIHTEVMPELEEVTATAITFDEAYGDMQLVVWVSAGQGDVYLLSKSRFLSMAANDAMLDLTTYVENGQLDVSGIDLAGGYVRSGGTGQQMLMGIPTDHLAGLSDYGVAPEGMVLSVLINGGNDTYAIAFLNALLTHLRTAVTGS